MKMGKHIFLVWVMLFVTEIAKISNPITDNPIILLIGLSVSMFTYCLLDHLDKG